MNAGKKAWRRTTGTGATPVQTGYPDHGFGDASAHLRTAS